MCTPDLVRLIEPHGLSLHLFVDDMQVYGCWSPEGMSDLATQVSARTDNVLTWKWSNKLQLNTNYTEFIRCVTSRWLHQLHYTAIRVGTGIISPSSTVCDLGVYIDSDLSMWVSRSTDDRGWLCCTSADLQCSSDSATHYAGEPGCVSGINSAWLRQCNAGWHSVEPIVFKPCWMLSPSQVFYALHTSPRHSPHWTGPCCQAHQIRVGDVDLLLSALCSPCYLSTQLTRVADIPSRQRHRSSATDTLLVHLTVTVGDWAFPVAVAKLWSELPSDVSAFVSLTAFRCLLKTCMFCVSYPNS